MYVISLWRRDPLLILFVDVIKIKYALQNIAVAKV
jgi:hypothetical protein